MTAKHTRSLRTISIALAIVAMGSAVSGGITFVDHDAAGTGDGTTWSNAYVHLQDALAAAIDLDGPVEIRVAQGLYRPDQGTNQRLGDRSATFRLLNNVTLRGGFAGAAAPDPNARDVGTYLTVLSGDLEDNDGPDFVNCEDNAEAVVTSISNDTTAVMDGFTITGGFGGFGPGLNCHDTFPVVQDCTFRVNMAAGEDGGYGGAVFVSAGGPVFSRCTFAGNWATKQGGAICSQNRADLTVHHCAFRANYADDGGAIRSASGNVNAADCTFVGNVAESHGGALYCHQGRHALTRCTFASNSARWGGGLYNLFGAMDFVRCTFTANDADEGGGVYIDSSAAVTLSHCLLAGNRARDWGGAMLAWCDSSPELIHCTIADNRAPEGSAVSSGEPVLWNCIVWNREATKSPFRVQGVGPAAGYSCIQGDFPGRGNLDTDPLFASPGHWDSSGTADDPSDDYFVAGDYHLRSEAGRWDPNSESWVADETTSRCIDAGDPDDGIGEEPFPNGDMVNMGAYGGTAEASKSPAGSPLCGQTAYEFVPGQSAVLQTGGFAGVNWTYRVEGNIHIVLDCLIGVASFRRVDAAAIDESSSLPRHLDLNEAFRLTSLVGSAKPDGTLVFSGKAADDSDVRITVAFKEDWVLMNGQTTPPAGTADFFIFSLDALLKRSSHNDR